MNLMLVFVSGGDSPWFNVDWSLFLAIGIFSLFNSTNFFGHKVHQWHRAGELAELLVL